MRIRAAALEAVFALIGVCCGVPPAAGATAGHGVWTTEQRWGPHNDWEPNIAAAPSLPWLYQMTTQYGGPRACRPQMNHCILFRSSPDRGRTWHQAIVMPRRQCPPGKPCRLAHWQNDPGIAVSSSGVVYAAWMNQWDVTFAKSRAGFRFPYRDYFGITVDGHGTSYLAWSEDTNYDGPGGTWWARNH